MSDERPPITRRDFVYVSGLGLAGAALGACGDAGTGGRGRRGSAVAGADSVAGSGVPGTVPPGGLVVPGDAWYGPGGVGEYAPSHGNTPEVLRVAHGIRAGEFDDAVLADAVDTNESYDVIVVGGGIAGLSAAHHFKRHHPGGRLLLLDNHPIFGGEAKRNDFEVDGVRLSGPQGSNDFIVPPATGEPDDYFTSLGIPRELAYAPTNAVPAGFAAPRDNYGWMHWVEDRYSVGHYFGREAGPNAAAGAGPSTTAGSGPGRWVRDPWGSGLARTPWSEEERAAVRHWRSALASDHAPADWAGGPDDPPQWLDRITLREYYEEVLGLPPLVTRYVDPILGSIIGLGCDSISAWWGQHFALPGFIGETPDAGRSRYAGVTFHSFPGGNAGLARFFVRDLVPGAIAPVATAGMSAGGPASAASGGSASAAPGGSASAASGSSASAAARDPADPGAVISGAVDFTALDRADQPVRMRLGATVVAVQHEGALDRSERVVVTYVTGGRAYRTYASAVVLASGGWVNRYVARDLPGSHRRAYASFVHAPVLVANVALRQWRFMADLDLAAFMYSHAAGPGGAGGADNGAGPGIGFSCNIRRPMYIGEHRPPFDPDSPAVLTFYVPFIYPGLSASDQGVRGRLELLRTSFADYERRLRWQMTELFGAAGFDAERDIAGIVLNRWGHAYVAPGPGFRFGTGGSPAPPDVVREPFGRVAIGHSELRGHQNWTGAAGEGRRALEALLDRI